MNIQKNFHIRRHPQIRQDLQDVCEELREKFEKLYTTILKVDPYNCYLEINPDRCIQLDHHELDSHRELSGYRAIDIIHTVEGYREYYRIVYRIIDTDRQKCVEIISFGLHNYAYDLARKRVRNT